MHVVGEGLGADRADGRHAQSLRLVAVFLEQLLGIGHDLRGALGAVGQVGAFVAVGGHEDAVEALLDAYSAQLGLIPLVQGTLITMTLGE